MQKVPNYLSMFLQDSQVPGTLWGQESGCKGDLECGPSDCYSGEKLPQEPPSPTTPEPQSPTTPEPIN